jgi:demethoxyubiquinone hydroxylase (CLK1/Coq7/Cat5 family)
LKCPLKKQKKVRPDKPSPFCTQSKKSGLLDNHFPKDILVTLLRINWAGELGAKRIYEGQIQGLRVNRVLQKVFFAMVGPLNFILHYVRRNNTKGIQEKSIPAQSYDTKESERSLSVVLKDSTRVGLLEHDEEESYRKTLACIKGMYKEECRHSVLFRRWIRAYGVRPSLLMPLWHVLGYGIGWISGVLGPLPMMVLTGAIESVVEVHYGAQIKEIEFWISHLVDSTQFKRSLPFFCNHSRLSCFFRGNYRKLSQSFSKGSKGYLDSKHPFFKDNILDELQLLHRVLVRCQEDEVAHKNMALSYDFFDGFWASFFYKAIQRGTRWMIFLSQHT